MGVVGFTEAVGGVNANRAEARNDYMEKSIMHSANVRLETTQVAGRLTTTTLRLLLVVVSCIGLTLAQKANQEAFPSVEQASHALFVAVESGNEQDIMKILGGEKALVSSDDEVQDKVDRKKFAQKYEEMHRFVREPDGSTFLYIGAENWPFPVPLVSKSDVWYFDADRGMREILFRRVGENEATAIDVCHDLVLASKPDERSPTGNGDDALGQYASTLVRAEKADPGANEQTATPFHGYYFRMLITERNGSSAAGGEAGSVAFIAYPAEYRSSGVLTFVITQDDIAYEADLGPNTAKIAKAMTAWKPSSKWHVAD